MTEEPDDSGESGEKRTQSERDEQHDSGESDSGPDAPLSDLRRDVEERRRRNQSDDADGVFADVDVGEVDEDAVWAELEASGDDPLFTTEENESGREVSVVKKRLCHECPHFADPPELSCTHEGTEIDAEVDTGHFRVLDCPMVDRPEHVDAAGLSGDDA